MKKKNKDKFRPGQRVFIKKRDYHCFDNRSIGIIMKKVDEFAHEAYDVKLTKMDWHGNLTQGIYARDLKRA